MRVSRWCAATLALFVSPAALAQAQDPNAPPASAAPQSAPPEGPAPIDLLAPARAPEIEHTEPPEGGPGGFEIGLRLDAQLPVGDTFSGTSLKSMVSGQAAAQVDAGWRIDPRWEVGAFFRYGLAFVNGCPQGVSCSAHNLRVGVEGQLHLSPGTSVDPWIGLGTGYEFFTLSASTAKAKTDVTYKGLTFALLEVGADYRLSDVLGMGPYVEASAGQFSSDDSGDLSRKSLHLWLGLGVRGWFDLR